ncbi:non-homologous end-joining DNA ligase [uncultured Jatrophihabitans sp.]|uniref:non-homologous end-joining DNA ligase n=1 Tax=uncultured Jatrophihabitans sp. TaxID=1610747 RepID=UPI0035CC2A6C
MADSAKVTVDVDGRHLSLSNLGKVLYPDTGFTKGEVIDYYSRIAPILLTHLADRPLTVKRYPNGVHQHFFYEKNAPRGAPDWVRTVNLPVPGSTKNRDTIDYVVVEELPTLVWLANLAALELHVPQWRIPRRARSPRTDIVVFDLDPGPPATIEQCCQVALRLRDQLQDDGLAAFAKTSGSKGMQVSAPVSVADPGLPSQYAHAIARRLERELPDLVVSRMTKALRPGKVLVDWSQNNPAKTTVAPYSLRAKDTPTVSTPVTWAEVEQAVEQGRELAFTAEQVLARVAEHGDLFGGVLDDGARTRVSAAMTADR